MRTMGTSSATMTDSEYGVFRKELKRLRRGEDLSGAAFGELVGCKAQHIYNVENGVRKPSPQLAERIADAFNVSVADMLVSHDDRTRAEREAYGRCLIKHRTDMGLSATVVAGALGIPLAVYKEYEAGLCSITDREIETLNKLLGIEEPKAKEPEAVEEKPDAEIPAEICDIILEHIKDLKVDADTQKKVWQFFSKAKMDAEERRLFG